MSRRVGGLLTAMALTAVGLSGASGPNSQSTQPAPNPVAAQMREHYRDALAMHTAVIRGDLAGVTSAAVPLIDYAAPPGMPDRSAAYVTTIQQAARDAAIAQTVLSAAVSSALMLNACGQCHRLVGTRPAVWLRPDAGLGGIVGHMLEHQRAADQILQGLVLPSDSLWREGAHAFAVAPLHSADLPVGAMERRRLSPSEERIHRLASEAAHATDPRARANYYGQLLSGCADCHSRSKRWGPGR